MAWITSWQRSRVRGANNLFPSLEAWTELPTAAVRQAKLEGRIPAWDIGGGLAYGAVWLRGAKPYDLLSTLRPHDREQCTFWHQFLLLER